MPNSEQDKQGQQATTGNKFHGKPSNRWAVVYPTHILYLYGTYSSKHEVLNNIRIYEDGKIKKISVRAWHEVDGSV